MQNFLILVFVKHLFLFCKRCLLDFEATGVYNLWYHGKGKGRKNGKRSHKEKN